MVIKQSLCKLLSILLVGLLSFSIATAQEIQVEAPSTVAIGDPFNISYIVRNAEIQDIRDVKFPSNVSVLYGPARSISSSMQSINGRTTQSTTSSMTYTLEAREKGRINIPATALLVGNKWITTRAISISVSNTASKGRNVQEGNSRSSGKFYYRAIPSKTTVYEQEYLPISYRLYASEGFAIQDRDPILYEGFLSHNLRTENQKVQQKSETYKGELFLTIDISHDALFAQHSGKLTLPANKITLIVAGEDPSDPFMSTQQEKIVRSEAVTIDVKPLPQEGKPQDFSGAVGNYTLSLTPTGEQKTGEVITLRIQIKGVGNLKTIKVPTLKLPDSFETYPIEDAYEPIMEDHPYAVRTIDYPIIARKEGEFTVPPISFNFFDPDKGQYRTVQTNPIHLHIAKGKERVADNGLVIGSDYSSRLMPLKLSPETNSLKAMKFFLSPWYFLAYLLIILVGGVSYYLLRRYQVLRADVVGFRESRAKLYATRKLKKAKTYVESGEREAFYNELLQTLWGYMKDKFRLSQSELTQSRIADALRARNTDSEIIEAWIQLINEVEFERFAPSSIARNMNEIYQHALDLIMSIENNKITK